MRGLKLAPDEIQDAGRDRGDAEYSYADSHEKSLSRYRAAIRLTLSRDGCKSAEIIACGRGCCQHAEAFIDPQMAIEQAGSMLAAQAQWMPALSLRDHISGRVLHCE